MVATIGRRLKELRNAVAKTQNEVASDLKFDSKTLRRYENDQHLPSSDNLIQLARYFKVTTDYILGLEECIPTEANNVVYPDRKNKEMFYEKVEGGEDYYWIFYEDQKDGSAILKYQSQWSGYTNETPPKEIREPRSVDVNKVLNVCNEIYTLPMIINNAEDILTFQMKRGHAIIKESLCAIYFPQVMEPFIVE